MDVRIGITNVARELSLEMEGEDTAVKDAVDTALSADGSMLWLIDRDGRQVGVPADRLAYVEIGSPEGGRRIGFAAE